MTEFYTRPFNADNVPLSGSDWHIVVDANGQPQFEGGYLIVLKDDGTRATEKELTDKLSDKGDAFVTDDTSKAEGDWFNIAGRWLDDKDVNSETKIAKVNFNLEPELAAEIGQYGINQATATPEVVVTSTSTPQPVYTATATPEQQYTSVPDTATESTYDRAPLYTLHSLQGGNIEGQGYNASMVIANPDYLDIDNNVQQNQLAPNDNQTAIAYLSTSQAGVWMDMHPSLKWQQDLHGDTNGDATGMEDNVNLNSMRWESEYTKFWDADFQRIVQEQSVKLVTPMADGGYGFDGVSFGTVNLNAYELFATPDVLEEYLNSQAFKDFQTSEEFKIGVRDYLYHSNDMASVLPNIDGNEAEIPDYIVQEARFGLYGPVPQEYVDNADNILNNAPQSFQNAVGENKAFGAFYYSYITEHNIPVEKAVEALNNRWMGAGDGEDAGEDEKRFVKWLEARELDTSVLSGDELNKNIDLYVQEKIEEYKGGDGYQPFNPDDLLEASKKAAADGNTTREEFTQVWWPNGSMLTYALTDTLTNSVLGQIEAAKAANPEAVFAMHESFLPNVKDQAKREELLNSINTWQMDGSLLNIFSVKLDDKGNVVSVSPRDDRNLLSDAQMAFINDVRENHDGDVTVEPIVELSAELLGISESQFNNLTVDQKFEIQKAIMDAFNSQEAFKDTEKVFDGKTPFEYFVAAANTQGVIAMAVPLRDEEGKIVPDNYPHQVELAAAAVKANSITANVSTFREQFVDNPVVAAEEQVVMACEAYTAPDTLGEHVGSFFANLIESTGLTFGYDLNGDCDTNGWWKNADMNDVQVPANTSGITSTPTATVEK